MSNFNFNSFKASLNGMSVETAHALLCDDPEFRNQVGFCPCCGANVKDRVITIYKELVEALYRVYRWCGEKQRHEFKMTDIKHLMDKSDYARFGDLIRCSGGIVYRPQDEEGNIHNGIYGMNMERAADFFHGRRPIPMQTILNQVTNQRLETHQVMVHELPRLYDLLQKDGFYAPENYKLPL